MFSFHDFILKGLKDAIGNLPDYKVRLNAAGWFEKEVLTLEDLAKLEELLEAKNNVVEETSEEEISELEVDTTTP